LEPIFKKRSQLFLFIASKKYEKEKKQEENKREQESVTARVNKK